MDSGPKSRTMHLLARLGVIAFALADLGTRVDGIAEGDHYFRQTHVLANVDKMLENGVFSAPSVWNHDMFLRFYDFPVYQGLVALFVSGFGGPVPVVAEVFNMACMLALLLLTWRLCAQLAIGAIATTSTLVILALAPLSRFWFVAPSIDPFVVTLSVASLVGWLELQGRPGPRRRWIATAVWLGAAFVATLIKSPVYAPVALVIAWQSLRQHGPRGLLRAGMLTFVAVMAAALVLFMAVSASVNAAVGGWPDRSTELAWYFGSWDERLSFESHTAVLERVIKQVLSVPVALVVLVAAVANRRWGISVLARSTVWSWSLASIFVCLLFLHVNVVHNYYQLPCIVPLALFAGVGVETVTRWFVRVRGSRRTTVTAALLVLLAGGAIWSSQRYLARLRAPSTAALRAAGEFVHEHTTANDFVLYGRPTHDNDPAYLYFAQRNGANVHGGSSPAALLGSWRSEAVELGGRLVLFVPQDLTAPRDLPQLASGASGRLFSVE